MIFADDLTGFGVWRQTGDESWCLDFWVDDDYDLYCDLDVERVTGVCGAVCGFDWEASANDCLAEYGFKLGRFDAAKGDGCKLVELGVAYGRGFFCECQDCKVVSDRLCHQY